MKKNIIIGLAICLLAMGSASCNSPTVNQSVTEPPSTITPSVTPSATPNSTTSNTSTTSEIYIFIPNETVEYMEISTIEVTDGTAKTLVENIINSDKTNLGFPKGTELLNLEIKDNTAYIDLNDLYYTPYNYGQTNGDTMYMYQIDSICTSLFYNRVFGIDEIVFLNEGKEVESIGPLATEKYNYYDFDYNAILKQNKYNTGGKN